MVLHFAGGLRHRPRGPWLGTLDDMDKLLADKGLLNQLVEIRHNVAEKAQDKLSQVGQNVANRAHDVVDRTSDLVVTAMGFLGVPYRRGGNSAESGFDCSGFVRAMYQQTVGLMLPRRADQQAASTQVIDKKNLQPGDPVFNTMRRAFSHVGIYVGDGKSRSTRPAAAPRFAWKACKPPTGHAALTAPVASQKMAQMPHHPNHKI